MKLSELKQVLQKVESVNFQLPDGTFVPNHFHVTEIGQITKHFIDCGGTIRTELKVNFQLWQSIDFDHRLAPQKLLDIIALSETKLHIEDAEIEVEYQANTIGKYHLDFDGAAFRLVNTKTDCLATDKCGVPAHKAKLKLSDLSGTNTASCSPESGCCS